MKRVATLGIAAALVAALAVMGVVVYLRGAEDRALSQFTMVTVLSSAEAIPAGTTLGDAVAQGLAAPIQFPSDYAPTNRLLSVTPENVNLVALDDLSAGQILMAGDFEPTADAPQLLNIPNGKAAVTITIGDEAQRVGAFLIPGSRVSVVSGGRVLFPSLEVLAVTGTLVTFAVNPSQMAPLIKASSPYLALLDQDTLAKKPEPQATTTVPTPVASPTEPSPSNSATSSLG